MQWKHALLNTISIIGLIVYAFIGFTVIGLIVVGVANVGALTLSCAKEPMDYDYDPDHTDARVTPERIPVGTAAPWRPDLPR